MLGRKRVLDNCPSVGFRGGPWTNLLEKVKKTCLIRMLAVTRVWQEMKGAKFESTRCLPPGDSTPTFHAFGPPDGRPGRLTSPADTLKALYTFSLIIFHKGCTDSPTDSARVPIFQHSHQNWVQGNRWQLVEVSHCWNERLRISKVRSQNEPCGTGWEPQK